MEKIISLLQEGKPKIKEITARISFLKALRAEISKNIPTIEKALKSDFNKPEFDTLQTEIFPVIHEIDVFIKKIKKWAKVKRVRTSIVNFRAKGYIYKEPMGVCYIASPWNYPFNLALMPLVGAIGSGNTVLLRPSEFSLNTTKIIETIIKNVFPEDIVKVVYGDAEFSNKILDHDFDVVFFTGSPRVGKIVYEKAAKHLSRVVLELGGKSPVIVTKTADITLAARRIVWGKFLNGGQTCVAPDYLLVDELVKKELLNEMVKNIECFYKKDQELITDFPSLINESAYERVKKYLNDGNVYYGGQFIDSERKIYPTILIDVTCDMNIMKEEIFGPILPVITYKSESEIFSIINNNPNPLALYLFSKDKALNKRIIENIPFGGGAINDTIMHMMNDSMPFGGIKGSGIGNYHGYASFKVFTHFKSVMHKYGFELKIKYPPYDEKKRRLVQKVGRLK